MRIETFKEKLKSGAPLAGTFVKLPSIEVVEVLAQSKLDFICLDAEHSPFDRARLDACLAIGRALDFPILVRPASASPENILQALDSGAVGIVAPHCDSAAKAAELAKMCHFGRGGRGYAGSTRWAGFASRPMTEVLAQDSQTVVIAQIEEPEGVEAVEGIAATPGIDGLFVGPADLTVGYGHTDMNNPDLAAAYARCGDAAKAHGLAYITFVANAAAAKALRDDYGVSVFFIASELGWMRDLANAQADQVHGS